MDTWWYPSLQQPHRRMERKHIVPPLNLILVVLGTTRQWSILKWKTVVGITLYLGSCCAFFEWVMDKRWHWRTVADGGMILMDPLVDPFFVSNGNRSLIIGDVQYSPVSIWPVSMNRYWLLRIIRIYVGYHYVYCPSPVPKHTQSYNFLTVNKTGLNIFLILGKNCSWMWTTRLFGA